MYNKIYAWNIRTSDGWLSIINLLFHVTRKGKHAKEKINIENKKQKYSKMYEHLHNMITGNV